MARLIIDRMTYAQTCELVAYLDVSEFEVDETCDAINERLIELGRRFTAADIVHHAKRFSDVAEHTLLEDYLASIH